MGPTPIRPLPGTRPASGPEAPAADRRQRRRDRTRAEIAEVAFRLATERGYDHVTVDDIADEADIAPRTFFRYFATKDDVFFLEREERLDRLRDTIRSRPVDEPVRTSMRAAIVELAVSFESDRELVVAKARLVRETPSLRARTAEHQTEWQRVLAEVVAERLGADPDTDLRSQMLAATAVAALQAAFNVWLAGDARTSFSALVAEALDLAADDG